MSTHKPPAIAALERTAHDMADELAEEHINSIRATIELLAILISMGDTVTDDDVKKIGHCTSVLRSANDTLERLHPTGGDLHPSFVETVRRGVNATTLDGWRQRGPRITLVWLAHALNVCSCALSLCRGVSTGIWGDLSDPGVRFLTELFLLDLSAPTDDGQQGIPF